MNNTNHHIRHGHKRRGKTSVEYKTWLAIKRRCYDTKYKDYPNWGGRGIIVCDRWLHDFPAFLEDMGNRPPDKHSIDRLDPNGNYEPGNCRWATMQEQGSENRRGIIPVVVNGISFSCLKKACEHFGILQTTLNERLKAGIPLQDAFNPQRLKPRRTRESYWPKKKREQHGLP